MLTKVEITLQGKLATKENEMSMGKAFRGLIFPILAAMAVLASHGAKTAIGKSERLNEVTPLDVLWEPAKGGLTHPHLELQIAVPVSRIAKTSQCLPVILLLKNTGDKEIKLIMEKPNLPWPCRSRPRQINSTNTWTLAEDKALREAAGRFCKANGQGVLRTGKVVLPNGKTFMLMPQGDGPFRDQRIAWLKEQLQKTIDGG